MADPKKDDTYSAAETQKRLDRALQRSLQMPPPAKAKKAVSRARQPSRKARKKA